MVAAAGVGRESAPACCTPVCREGAEMPRWATWATVLLASGAAYLVGAALRLWLGA